MGGKPLRSFLAWRERLAGGGRGTFAACERTSGGAARLRARNWSSKKEDLREYWGIRDILA